MKKLLLLAMLAGLCACSFTPAPSVEPVPSETASGEVIENKQLDEEDGYEYLILDTGDNHVFGVRLPSDYGIFYDFNAEENEFYLTDGVDSFSEGFFGSADSFTDVITTVTTDASSYEIMLNDEVDAGLTTAKRIIGYCDKDTDIFNAQTPFAIVVFEEVDLCFIMAGFTDKDVFYNILKDTEYRYDNQQ